MKTFRIGALIISIVFLASCSEDEGTPDFVGESVGTYNYSTTVLRANKNTPDNLAGTLTLSRNEDDITIVIDNIESMESSRIEITSKGYAFNIKAATLTDNDGDLVNRTGVTSTTIKGTFYHGRYETETKKLYLKASYTYQDSKYSQYNFSADVTATKK